MQKAHLVALIGICDKHSGHVFVLASAFCFFASALSCIFVTGFTIMKNTTIARIIKLISTFKNEPIRNILLLKVKDIDEKST